MILIQKAIIKRENKYLIGLRSPNAKYYPLHWDLPGGKLEPNEDPFLGIAREVKEETNLDIKPIKVLGVYEMDLDNKGENTHRFTIYSTEIVSGEVKLSSEHVEQRWVTKEELFQLPKSNLLNDQLEPYFEPFFEENLSI
ncbi:MAG: NUDIX domain-containing protein [Candidatus Paceibacterota bacterium]|jgi:8-oxo-dGTP diphosphatase